MQVPAFFRGPVKGYRKTDFLTDRGALMLCKAIEAAWAAVGHPEIKAVPYEILLGRNEDSRIWGIRIHGLLNGLPIKRKEEAA